QIQSKVDDITFVVIGDGGQENQLKANMQTQGVSNIIFTGKLLPANIPEYLNIFNVLIIPSLNEGMPRVILEALACGVHVVGSDVGGIPEAIGGENSFPLNQDFVENIANRTIELLTHDISPTSLPDEFSWGRTVKQEI